MNPYKDIPIYGQDTIMSYKNKQREETKPHIYAITDLAFRNMLEEQENQSILVTGESGAGKTENTKKVIQYLAAITSSNVAMPSHIVKSPKLENHPTFEQQILQANPILEAFGNAQTVRNNNSSRFGKFIRIEFGRSGQIAGASIDWYLLEKSRVIYQNPKERNYHIFYQLIQGLPKDLRESLIIEADLNAYAYLRDSNKEVKGVNDKAELEHLINSFRIMGFSTNEQNQIFRVMSAILNIGNIELGSERSDQARILNITQVERVCHLLGINSEQFVKGLLRPKVKAGREWVHQSRNAEQVKNTLEALAKSLYERTFGSIVDKINQTLERSNDNTSFIGVLDIAGFEIFEHNSFEQLCINYTNEKLQQFFNHHMFVLEQEEYSRENIEWKYIDFGHDLQPTIDLIEKPNPIGIFSCLDEDCVMPKATDKSFTDKLHHLWQNKSTKYRPARLSQGFVLTHYAAEVEYSTEGWLEKNKDPLNDNVTQLLVQSSEAFIKQLFASEAVESGLGGKMTKKGLFRTVAQRHKEQLNFLMTQLNSTHPHFVRCIIPNHEKTPHKLDNLLVLDQLRCNGVLEGIRIARTGYPNRIFFSEFRQRYEVLVSKMPKGYVEGQKACQIILQKLHLDENLYKVGLTKVFFKSGVLAELEERRETMVRELTKQFQSIARGYLQRQKVRKTLFKSQATSLIRRNFQLYLNMKDNPWWKTYVKMRPLLMISRETGPSEAQLLELKKLEQTCKTMETERESLKDEQRKVEQQLTKMQETLESERRLALDKEEFLKRSQEREADLEDQLTGALDDLDKLEVQCEELLIAKKKVDAQADVWRSELENGAQIIGTLEEEKAQLKKRIAALEEELAHFTSNHVKGLEKHERLAKELGSIRELLGDREKIISELEETIAKSEEQHKAKIAEVASDLESARSGTENFESQLQEQREQLDELCKNSAYYEELARKKEVELEKVAAELKEQNSKFSANEIRLKASEKELAVVSQKLKVTEQEVASLKSKCDKLEKDEKEARRLLEAKVSDSVKNDEGRKLLDRKVNDLTSKLSKQEETLTGERQKHIKEISTKQSAIEKLANEKEKLAASVKELEGVRKVKDMLTAELETARAHASQTATVRAEMAGLKKKLQEHEDAREQGLQFIQDLKGRLNDAVTYSNKLKNDLDQALNDKHQLTQQISQLKKFIDDDLANKEHLILEKNNIIQQLENSAQENSTLKFENQKLSKELEKKGDHLRRMRTSFTDDSISQRTKLNKEKADLEAREKKLAQELEDFKVEVATLQKQKQKMNQTIEDLNHDVSREQKSSSSAERLVESLQDQLAKLKESHDKERRDRSESEMNKRKLNSQLEAAKKELAEKSGQLVALQKVIKPSHSRNRSMDVKSSDSDFDAVDLARRLELAESKLKQTQESKKLLESQLSEAQKRNKELSRNDSGSSVASRRSRLEEMDVPSSPNARRSLKTTNGIKSTIDSMYGGSESTFKPMRGHFRTKSSIDSFDKENNSLMSISESVKQLNLRNKSIEEVEDLITNYESSKRDMLSLFQETSKKMLDIKDELARSEQERTRLEKELGQLPQQPQEVESNNNLLTASISDLELRLDAEVAMNQDLNASLKLYKARAEDYYSKLESAETVVLKASRAESFAKAQWKDAEKALAAVLKENKEQESKSISLQSQIQLLEDKLEDSTIDLSHSREAQKRLTKEIQDLKDRRMQDSSDMENSLNSMRDRYKEEIRTISEELEKEKANFVELQTENRHLHHELDMLKVRNDFDTLDPSWSTFKSQLEDKIQELTKANEEAVMSHQDSQRRVGSLLSQIRTLRTTMEEITANRDQLQEEKRVLERRLNEVSEQFEELAQTPGVHSSSSSSDELNELRAAIRQHTEAANAASEKLKVSENSKLELQKQLDSERQRLQDSALERSTVEKENKELHLKLVDLEAQLLGVKNYDAKFMAQKIGELERQLEEQSQRYTEESRSSRTNDRLVKDLQNQIQQKEKHTAKLEDELNRNETKIKSLQETIENIQGLETTQRLASRRAEREARDLKETSLRLEKELEDWKSRFHSISKRSSRSFA